MQTPSDVSAMLPEQSFSLCAPLLLWKKSAQRNHLRRYIVLRVTGIRYVLLISISRLTSSPTAGGVEAPRPPPPPFAMPDSAPQPLSSSSSMSVSLSPAPVSAPRGGVRGTFPRSATSGMGGRLSMLIIVRLASSSVLLRQNIQAGERKQRRGVFTNGV